MYRHACEKCDLLSFSHLLFILAEIFDPILPFSFFSLRAIILESIFFATQRFPPSVAQRNRALSTNHDAIYNLE